MSTITGTAQTDTLKGTIRDDVIFGLGGQDELRGRSGDDSLFGGEGEDTLKGGKGLDSLDGGLGNDELRGGAGDDSLIGGNGDDTLRGGQGNDTLASDSGSDESRGGAGDDYFTFVSSFDDFKSDTLRGGAGEDTLYLAGSVEDYQFTKMKGGSVLPGGIKIHTLADQLAMQTPHVGDENTLFTRNIEWFEFEDGSRLSKDALDFDNSLKVIPFQFSTDEDTSINGQLTGGGKSWYVVNPGVQTGISGNIATAKLTLNKDGSFTYSVNGSLHGNGEADKIAQGSTITDQGFTFKISNGSETIDLPISFLIKGINDRPVANGDTAATTQAAVVQIDALANDTDIDGPHGDIKITGISQGSHGVAKFQEDTATGKLVIRYLPDEDTKTLGQGESITDTISYKIQDEFYTGIDVGASIDIIINGTNDKPVAVNDTAITDEDTPVNIDVLANDTDIDKNDVLKIIAVSDGEHGTAAIVDGRVVYTPNESVNALPLDASIKDTISYKIQDQFYEGRDIIAQVEVEIFGLNDVPVVTGDDRGTLVIQENPRGGGSVDPLDFIVTGKLNIQDPDEGESFFNPRTGIDGQFGTLDINEAGDWLFQLDLVAASGIAPGTAALDAYAVDSADGTAHNIAIDIFKNDFCSDCTI